MKKHLIAAAVAGIFAVPAMAEVTVYGRVDQAYNTVKNTSGATTNQKSTGIASIAGASRLGVRGEEDLGGGLKASFTFEYGLATDESTGIGTSRLEFLGLSGGLGSLTVGHQYTLTHSVQGAMDPNGNASAAGWGGGWNNTARSEDTVIYTTPNLQGFTASVSQALAGRETSTTTTTKAGDATGFALAYTAGPLSVRAAQTSTKATVLTLARPGQIVATDLSNALGNRKAQSVGASYNLGVATVYVLNNTAKAGSSADSGKSSANNVGLRVPLGAVTVNATVSNGKYTDSGAASVKLSGHMLGANYALSKRTAVYSFVGEAKDKTATNPGKHSTFALGVGHTF